MRALWFRILALFAFLALLGTLQLITPTSAAAAPDVQRGGRHGGGVSHGGGGHGGHIGAGQGGNVGHGWHGGHVGRGIRGPTIINVTNVAPAVFPAYFAPPPVLPVYAPVAVPVAVPVLEPVAVPVLEPVAVPVLEPVPVPVYTPWCCPVRR